MPPSRLSACPPLTPDRRSTTLRRPTLTDLLINTHSLSMIYHNDLVQVACTQEEPRLQAQLLLLGVSWRRLHRRGGT